MNTFGKRLCFGIDAVRSVLEMRKKSEDNVSLTYTRRARAHRILRVGPVFLPSDLVSSGGESSERDCNAVTAVTFSTRFWRESFLLKNTNLRAQTFVEIDRP